MTTAVMFAPRSRATAEQIASANRYLSSCDEKAARRLYGRIVARLNAAMDGDPYGWDVPTARVLGHGHMLDVASMAANRVNQLAFPIAPEV